ncbi:MAG: hypothetical protein EOM91_21870 [Sphingobacteriia bacterium]|nr:hypothetical protein [Sphingobacteriia bacterium]
MTATTADTTDRQIAVRAANIYYPDGAPPERCEHLLMQCEWIDAQRDEPLIEQALRTACDSYGRLDVRLARSIAAAARDMRDERARARRARALSEAGRIAKPHQQMIDRICELSRAAGEIPAILDGDAWRPDDDFYVEVIRHAQPDMSEPLARAISMVCAHRMSA